ncbi:Outer membrane protein beta-barrel domain-containing protein [Chitinophaga jiangningensis]|uniref:Outer membrane protein beta-barrel domain-containing protein n=1 Tax=Chitinophaga jiangningensis TaxID=1419482 RepID=A0A1M7I116_9BACT|nr:porin family protein [Chitinophaga jiangningensis]SHM34434.1 Outer membrane protein beta-barrel domain-containing protein [Chitinophaga jiangningensis]
MKNFTLAVATACLTVSVASAQVSLGVRGGYVNSNLSITSGNSQTAVPGTEAADNWNVGLVVNIPLTRNFYLQPIVNYEVKGAKLNPVTKPPAGAFSTATTKVRLPYITLPVNAVYKVPVGNARLSFGLGPYVAYSLNAKYNLAVYDDGKKVQDAYQPIDFSKSPNVPNSTMQLGRWDVGGNALISLEMNNYITVGANYSLGLLDIDRSDDLKIKNRSFGISIGVLLNREDW